MKKDPIKFLFATTPGGAVTFAIIAGFLYWIAPVMLQLVVFSFLIRNMLLWLTFGFVTFVTWNIISRYRFFGNQNIPRAIISLVVFGLGMPFFDGCREHVLSRQAAFVELDVSPRVSSTLARYTPMQVASQEIIRRTQKSQYTPGHTRAQGSESGVAFVAPLIPQGIFNTLFVQNKGVMYFDDGGTDEKAQRVQEQPSEYFAIGEGMEILDDVHRHLVHEIGFFKSYPEIYYVRDGNDVLGVVPYVSYRFYWGLWIPYWGGVAIIDSDGNIADSSPQEAQADKRLQSAQRLFPEKLARVYVDAQRYDVGWWGGLIKRENKIEIPKLPGKNQLPYFLPMEDGSYQYVTMTEPDGDAYSLMRTYYVDAHSGALRVYSYDKPGRDGNLLGPRKVLSFAKTIPGYNWYEKGGGDSAGSGTYRLVEPRPVDRGGSLFWMISITPKDYSRVIAKVFVDAGNNEVVVGPFHNREDTLAWLAGKTVQPPSQKEPEVAVSAYKGQALMCEHLIAVCGQLPTMCPAPKEAKTE